MKIIEKTDDYLRVEYFSDEEVRQIIRFPKPTPVVPITREVDLSPTRSETIEYKLCSYLPGDYFRCIYLYKVSHD